jgi:hypothetical protein
MNEVNRKETYTFIKSTRELSQKSMIINASDFPVLEFDKILESNNLTIFACPETVV